MKKFIKCLLTSLMLAGCTSVKMVGDLNMISTRNIDAGANYELIKTGTDNSKAAFRKSKSVNVDQAVNDAVTGVPGGEFLKNAKLYTDGKKWAVVGDVWGLTESANVEGFKIGDVVYIKNSLVNKTISGEKFTKAKVTGFQDKKSCLVEMPGGEIKAVNYSDLSKSGE